MPSVESLTRKMTESQIERLSQTAQGLRKDILFAKKKIMGGLHFNREMEMQFLRLFLAAIFNRDDTLNESAYRDFALENGMNYAVSRMCDARVNVDQWDDEYRAEYVKTCKRYDLL